jgi:DNA repair and recombination protein RAD52
LHRPGEQHLNSGGRIIANPFEETKNRISEYTAQDIATLQSKLAKQLGPEYLSSRAGPGGGKVHYVPAEKCIQLANEVFGFNGWSSQIMDVQVDFVDENPTTLKVSLGLSVIMRVTLKDGTFHEDIGYGHIENCKGKAAAFEKAKKEGTTDGLKRALKNFGNVLGNCIYDKEYLQKVTKVKVQPYKWDVANLYRPTDHFVKMESVVPKFEEKIQSIGAVGSPCMELDTVSDTLLTSNSATEDTLELEDEFGG